MKTRTTAVTCLAAGLVAASAGAETITVPTGDAPTITIALNIAEDGDEIVVGPGTYFESLNLLGKEITLRSSDGPEVTTIDAFGQFDSAIHAVSGETLNTRIEGFTITGGNADGIDDGDAFNDERGGGLYVRFGSLTVVDCVFIGNQAANVGGAVYVNNDEVPDASIHFEGCVFEQCEAVHGGGVYFFETVCSFVDCAFLENVATGGSGGGLRFGGGAVTMLRCDFEGNIAAAAGGAFFHNSPMSVDASSFTGNQAQDGGAFWAAAPITMRDSIVNGNAVTGAGGGVYVASAGVLDMTNTTVSHNIGSHAIWNNGSATIVSSILWANPDGDVGGDAVAVSYSVLAGGTDTNVDADPMFVDAAGDDGLTGTADDDLRLAAGSPAIDAGDASAVIGEYPLDWDGNPRAVNDPDVDDTGLSVLGLAVDAGAFERQVAPPPPSCPGDLNGDGQINGADLGLLLGGWGGCG